MKLWWVELFLFLFTKDIYQESYECLTCRKREIKAHIEKAPVPEPVISHSIASPSSVAWVMHEKFVNAMPLLLSAKLKSH